MSNTKQLSNKIIGNYSLNDQTNEFVSHINQKQNSSNDKDDLESFYEAKQQLLEDKLSSKRSHTSLNLFQKSHSHLDTTNNFKTNNSIVLTEQTQSFKEEMKKKGKGQTNQGMSQSTLAANIQGVKSRFTPIKKISIEKEPRYLRSASKPKKEEIVDVKLKITSNDVRDVTNDRLKMKSSTSKSKTESTLVNSINKKPTNKKTNSKEKEKDLGEHLVTFINQTTSELKANNNTTNASSNGGMFTNLPSNYKPSILENKQPKLAVSPKNSKDQSSDVNTFRKACKPVKDEVESKTSRDTAAEQTNRKKVKIELAVEIKDSKDHQLVTAADLKEKGAYSLDHSIDMSEGKGKNFSSKTLNLKKSQINLGTGESNNASFHKDKLNLTEMDDSAKTSKGISIDDLHPHKHKIKLAGKSDINNPILDAISTPKARKLETPHKTQKFYEKNLGWLAAK